MALNDKQRMPYEEKAKADKERYEKERERFSASDTISNAPFTEGPTSPGMPAVSLDTGPRTIERSLSEYFPSSNFENRGPYTDNDLQKISSLLESIGRLPWSNVPRIYTVLRTIGHLELIDGFIDEGLTDFWFPFSASSLPGILTPTVKAAFIESQSLVITKALELEKGSERKHAHFDRNDLIPFQVIGRLGEGLHGSVDRVLSVLSHREYARKRFRRSKAFSNQKEDIRTFKTELQVLKRISHLHCIELVRCRPSRVMIDFHVFINHYLLLSLRSEATLILNTSHSSCLPLPIATWPPTSIWRQIHRTNYPL